MPNRRDPVLHGIAIRELRPTQMTVGYREVSRKRGSWDDRKGEERRRFLENHMVPVVIGPDHRRYVIDHHHLCRALLEEGCETVFTVTVRDLTHIEKKRFWTFLEMHGWAHAYDEKGKRRDFSDIPRSIEHMIDDPYRSLAGEVRRAGGFAKDLTPFNEFLWADYFRDHVKAKMIDDNFDKALKRALKLARSHASSHLPGWCGPEEIEKLA